MKTGPDGDEVCSRCYTRNPFECKMTRGNGPGESTCTPPPLARLPLWGTYAQLRDCDGGIPKFTRTFLKKSVFEPGTFGHEKFSETQILV